VGKRPGASVQKVGKERAGNGIPNMAEETGKNYTTLHNILQLVNCKVVGANKKGQELAGIQGLRTQEGWTPCLSTMPISGGLKLPTSRTL